MSLAAGLYGQSQFAQVSGTVQDQTGALIPGVTVTATDVNTGVVTTQLTNEAGAYLFASLLPGTYKISAALSGFQTQTLTDVRLGQGEQYRFNFSLKVANAATSVEVSIPTDSLIATSSSTVGQVLTEQRIEALPLVGNNVLNLISTLAGVGNDAGNINSVFGREAVTLAGVATSNVTTMRDGIMVQDTRWPGGINSATVMNPDLVGEIRLILAPVDAELGRGNGSVQISTRSGTNRFAGSATWSFRNSALNADTWANNRSVPHNPPNWVNDHQYTVAYGGPIIKNKTFFYAVFDGVTNRNRSLVTTQVLTPCARLGIFRYYDRWNNGNATSAETTGVNAATPVVDLSGNPRRPAFEPNTNGATPYTGDLRFISVFGPLASNPTKNDCSDAAISATTLRPNGTASSWDPYRTQLDTTGFIKRFLAYIPTPNTYETGDGLNTAAFRWIRKLQGTDNLFGFGEDIGNRRQYNIKIDHNFNQKHKANVNWSYERNNSSDTAMYYPNTWEGSNYRRPDVITASFTSTLSPSLLNEARFGYRVTGTNIVASFDNPLYRKAADELYPPYLNKTRVIVRPGTGGVSYQIFGPAGARGAWPSTLSDHSPVWTYADTVSWTIGKHAFKWGAEVRRASSKYVNDGPGDFGAYDYYFQALGGNITASTPTNNQTTSIANTNPAMATLANTNAQRARDLATMLAGSLGPGFGTNAFNQRFYMSDPKNLDTWTGYAESPYQTRDMHQNEMSVFAKDDYKVRKNLTLNLGVRWEYYGVPFNASGLTVAPVGGGAALFGVSGRGFDGWMRPSAITNGQLYDASLLTNLQFVGPNSPNSGKGAYRSEYNNFGPAIGFAWNVPWFGEGKTTLRGGYQITYQKAASFSTLDGILATAPGSSRAEGYDVNPANLADNYLDLTDITSAIVPLPTRVKPMQAIPISDRNTAFTAFDPNFASPYVQNLTMTLTRNVRRNLTAELRYVGTIALKQYKTLNLNSADFLYNGLLDELTKVRAGGESAMLDQMFAGINMCATGCAVGTYGPVGTPGQTAAAQMRASTTFNTNLANGNFLAIATTLNTLNYTKTATANQNLPDIPAGVRGAVLRFSGKFPENFITTNPQYSAANLAGNTGHSNYHSMQAQLTLRPTHGMSATASYTWSKNLGTPGTFSNPVDRNEWTIVNSNRGQELRANGVIELPIGPNKLFFGNTSGAMARALERWQVSFIYNTFSGAWQSFSAQNNLYANGVPDIVDPSFNPSDYTGFRWGYRDGANLNGRYFDPTKFVSVPDQQCAALPTTLGSLCTLDSLALIVPAGTPGSFLLTDGTNRSAKIVLQNAQPGKRGNLGQNVFKGLPTWQLDANISKAFRLTESKAVQFRVDAANVMNHPQPNPGSFSINDNASLGLINSKTGSRTFQGQIRLTF